MTRFAIALLLVADASAWDTCRTFKQIYPSGKELCEKMWGDSFEYTTDETQAYTMWFFDALNNPNNAVAAALGKDPTPDTCKLQYFHKSAGQSPGDYHSGIYTAPSPEGDNFTECHPWKESSCCHNEVVTTPQAINEAYGAGYHWDRCDGFIDGYTMSEACQRFFVQEACMYECDPHSGEYRRYTDGEADAFAAWSAIEGNPTDFALGSIDDPAYVGTFEHDGVSYEKSVFWGNGIYGPNKWQMHKMPIKASYCDAFYTACQNDYFCGEGDFWECSADYKASAAENAEAAEAAALNETLSRFPPAIQAEVRAMGDITSATAAEVAQSLVDRQAAAEKAVANARDDVPSWAIVLIICLAVIFALVAFFMMYIVKREKQGQPVFTSIGAESVGAVQSGVKSVQISTVSTTATGASKP